MLFKKHVSSEVFLLGIMRITMCILLFFLNKHVDKTSNNNVVVDVKKPKSTTSSCRPQQLNRAFCNAR